MAAAGGACCSANKRCFHGGVSAAGENAAAAGRGHRYRAPRVHPQLRLSGDTSSCAAVPWLLWLFGWLLPRADTQAGLLPSCSLFLSYQTADQAQQVASWLNGYLFCSQIPVVAELAIPRRSQTSQQQGGRAACGVGAGGGAATPRRAPRGGGGVGRAAPTTAGRGVLVLPPKKQRQLQQQVDSETAAPAAADGGGGL